MNDMGVFGSRKSQVEWNGECELPDSRLLEVPEVREYLYLEVPELRLLHTVLSFVEYCWPDINSDFKEHES